MHLRWRFNSTVNSIRQWLLDHVLFILIMHFGHHPIPFQMYRPMVYNGPIYYTVSKLNQHNFLHFVRNCSTLLFLLMAGWSKSLTRADNPSWNKKRYHLCFRHFVQINKHLLCSTNIWQLKHQMWYTKVVTHL